MKSYFVRLSARHITIALCAVSIALFIMYQAVSAVAGPVTPATGGTNISIDTTSAGTTPAWTTINGPVIREANLGDMELGVHTLTLPPGWEFNTSANVIIGISSGNPSDFALAFSTITPAATTLSFNVTHVSTTGIAEITFNNLQVRPTGTVVGTGNITMTAGVIAGVDSSTNFGTLTSVPGAPTKLAFTTQPSSSTVYGSAFSTQPVVKVQDQFGNDTSGTGGPNNVTLTLNGSGSILGTATLDIGSTGVATFLGLSISDVGTGKTLTATATGLTQATSASFDITPKPLTASITASDKTYDGDATATITGRTATNLVGTDSVTLSGGTAAFSDANAGINKTVSATGMTMDAVGDHLKYTFDGNGSGTATINKASVTVTADAQTKVYGEADPSFSYVPSASLIAGNSFTGTLSRASGENVGSYALTIGSLSAGGNYTITFVPANLTVTTRPITVTAVSATKVYDQNTTSAGIPTITSGTLAFSNTPNFTQAYTTASVGTGKTLTPSGTVNDGNSGLNYAVTFVNDTTGSITKKELTVSGLSAAGKVYDGNTTVTVNGTPALVGVISPDDVSIAGTASGTFVSPNAGTNNVTTTGLSLLGTEAGNYSLTHPTLSATITPKPVTVTPNVGQTKVYGDVDPTFTFTTSALIGGDTVTGNPARATGEAVGTYSINALGTLSASSNYSLSVDPRDFTITPAPLTITAVAKTKVYGTADPVLTVGYTGLKFTDAAPAVLASISRAVGENVGTYTITPSGASDPNYTISYGTANLTITPATLTVTADNKSKEYTLPTTPDDPLTYTTGSFANGDTASIMSGSLVRVAGEAIGTYAINQGSVAASANYTISFTPGTFSIVDTTAPVIAAHADVNAVADQLGGATTAAAYTAPTASDAGDGPLPAICTPASGSLFVIGTTVVTCTKTDAHGNVATPTTFNVNVVPGPINKFAIAASPASVDITSFSTITVTGQDVYGNTANDSSTIALLATDGGASLANGFLTLSAGVANTQMTKTSAGVAHAVVSSGVITPKQTTVTFTDASDHTAPVVTAVRTNKSSYEATNDANITVTVNEDNTASSVTVNGNTATETSSGVWTVTFTKSTTVGTHSLTVLAADISGNVSTTNSSYNVIANAVVPVTPTVTLVGSAIVSAYSETEAQTRFASGLRFSTTNAASITVNGTSVTPAATITAATLANATTLGAHTYNVVVTSSTGHTAELTVAYQVNANAVVPVTPTVTLVGTAVASIYTLSDAQARFTLANGLQVTTTNAASVTVNGTSVTPAATLTVASQAAATTLGAHVYDIVVTSSTGHTASLLVAYHVNADSVAAVTPTVALAGAAAVSSYTASEAATRFASGVQFDTTNAASVTVNGTSVSPAATITAATLANATTLGAHTYNVVVTSSTGHTANATVSYLVTADPVVQGNGTLAVTGINTIKSTMTADDSYANGGSWTMLITVPTTETNLALKFGDWVSGANSIATANNMRVYSAQSSNAANSGSPITITAANTYATALVLTGDLDANTEGRQVQVTVDLKVPAGTAGGSYSTNYGVQSN